MKADERTFADLLKQRKVFAIPAFQRRYAWRARNFEKLWEDLREVVDGSRKRHFMGTVVFDPFGSQLSVVDGQQRLATFTIILKVLEGLSLEYSPKLTAGISKLLIVKGHPLIRPSLYDRPSFDVLLDNPTLLKKGEHKAVRECYDFFYSAISSHITTVSGQRPAHFRKIHKALLEKMVFVEILLAHDDDTHAIFETINYTGVPLSAADLARNFVLSRAKGDEEQQRLNSTYWQPLEQILMSSLESNGSARKAEFQRVLPEFLRATLVAENGKYISSTDLFRALRSYFGTKDLEQKLQVLIAHANQYARIIKPSLERRDRISRQLSRMSDLRMTTYNPVLLVLLKSNSEGSMKAAELLRALQYVESFIVRRAFNSKVSRDLHKVFARVAGEIRKEQKGSRILARLVTLLKDAKWPEDSEFRPCFLSSPIYASAPAMARFALLSLERNRPASNERTLDHTVQIEHVFPQGAKPEDWAPEQMPELKRRLHAMGNLTLTANNPKLSNHGFHEKCNGRHGYKKSPYWLTKTLTKYKKWSSAEIDKRGEYLLRQALRLWPRP